MDKREQAKEYNRQGLHYRDQEKDAWKAIEMFEKAIALCPDIAALYNNAASAYFNLSQSSGEDQALYMKKTVEYFTKAAEIDSAAYFYLGNLYTPGMNQPFADDYDLAFSYYQKVQKDAGAIWANTQMFLGLYYEKHKKDPLRGAAYYSLALQQDPLNKKLANYFQLAFSKVKNRSFWKERFAKITDGETMEKEIQAGIKELTIHCPKCNSAEVGHISPIRYVRQSLTGTFGFNRLEKYKKYTCKNCGEEW